MMKRCDAQEDALILRARQGDAQAVEALLSWHASLLHALASRLCCPAEAHAELVQAGVVGLLQALERYDPGRGVRLITYAVPWILGEMRRALREICAMHDTLSLDEAGENSPPLADTLRSSEGVDVEALSLRMAMQQLSREEQLLLCLRYDREKTQKETAALLHRSQAQISRMERRALDHLRALLC